MTYLSILSNRLAAFLPLTWREPWRKRVLVWVIVVQGSEPWDAGRGAAL